MGDISTNTFDLGWQPSFDDVNAPSDALLRMDNCVLDERGAVALRPGSAKVNSAAFTDGDAQNLYTTQLNSSKVRFVGAGNDIYAGGSSIHSNINGSGDIAFGSHMGHVLFCRGTDKLKYAGSGVTNLGIAAPNAAPTLTAIAADEKTFASFDSGESPAFNADEGSIAFANDKDGNANSAMAITPNSTTGRAVVTKTFASPTDFTSYDSGQDGSDDDLIEFYVYLTEPQYTTAVQVRIDVNDGAFTEDFYSRVFFPNEATEKRSVPETKFFEPDYTAEGYERYRLEAELEGRDLPELEDLEEIAVPGSVSWLRFTAPRGDFLKFGTTTGKDWSTVKAVRFSVIGTTGGSGAIVRVDNLKIIGGSERPLTGRFKAIVVPVYNDGDYNAIGVPSAASSEIEVRGEAIRATVSAGTITALDGQTNELWLFLFGGRLNAYYRFTVKTGGPFSGAQTIDATISERSALITNVRLETDNVRPPDNIIGIEGPHYDRTLYLTAKEIYPSRQLNPDACSSDEVVTVGDDTESALWIKKLSEYVYLGTTKDIYRLDGDWTVLPDETVNVSKRPLGVSNPPISKAVTVGRINGVDAIVYLSGNGWQVLNGPLLTGPDSAVALLWQGKTRHGVSPVNITSSSARFRCAIAKNRLYCLTPEGSSTTSSTAIHRYDFDSGQWSRFTYSSAFRDVYAEYDGTLIGGDSSGFQWTLDEATQQDAGTDISVTIWTPYQDDGLPFVVKDFKSHLLNMETGGNTATVAFHLDGSSTADSTTISAAPSSGTDLTSTDVSALTSGRQIQHRITGSFSTFVLRGLSMTYLDAPESRVIWDTGFIDLSDREVAWIRAVRVKCRPTADLTLTPYFDGTADTVRTIDVLPTLSGKVYPFEQLLGRQAKGRQIRLVVTSSSAFPVWWIELEYNISGKKRQKRVERFAGAA